MSKEKEEQYKQLLEEAEELITSLMKCAVGEGTENRNTLTLKLLAWKEAKDNM